MKKGFIELLLAGVLLFCLGVLTRQKASGIEFDEQRTARQRDVPPLAAPMSPSEERDVARIAVTQAAERGPLEWQGMPIGDIAPPCEVSSDCGMARACLNDKCVGCQQDDCAIGEQCVLQHCVISKLVGCKSNADCRDGAVCVLSGYTRNDPRGNSDMTSFCVDESGGVDE